MIGTATFYTPDPAKEVDDAFAPRLYGVTVAQARELAGDHLVMWTDNDERFSAGLRAPSPYCLFFYHDAPIINPYALFKPLPDRPTR